MFMYYYNIYIIFIKAQLVYLMGQLNLLCRYTNCAERLATVQNTSVCGTDIYIYIYIYILLCTDIFLRMAVYR